MAKTKEVTVSNDDAKRITQEDIERALATPAPLPPQEPGWEERILTRVGRIEREAARKRCKHAKTYSGVQVEFFADDGSSEMRMVDAMICERCGAWLGLGKAAVASADLIAGGLIQLISLGRILPAPGLPEPGYDRLGGGRNKHRVTTGELCGWEAVSAFHGTDLWDGGWIAAACFDYDAVADYDADDASVQERAQ